VWRVFFCIIALPANLNILALKALVMFPNARKIFFTVFTGERHWFIWKKKQEHQKTMCSGNCVM
jgi:hypothetical protein